MYCENVLENQIQQLAIEQGDFRKGDLLVFSTINELPLCAVYSDRHFLQVESESFLNRNVSSNTVCEIVEKIYT